MCVFPKTAECPRHAPIGRPDNCRSVRPMAPPEHLGLRIFQYNDPPTPRRESKYTPPPQPSRSRLRTAPAMHRTFPRPPSFRSNAVDTVRKIPRRALLHQLVAAEPWGSGSVCGRLECAGLPCRVASVLTASQMGDTGSQSLLSRCCYCRPAFQDALQQCLGISVR